MECMNFLEWLGFFDEYVLCICLGFVILKLICCIVGIELSFEFRDDI